ncbi:MAG TPA: DUF935 family protein [Bacteroidales bacterium]|nr:DUF935 family protein [Bacteroidales bacterium]
MAKKKTDDKLVINQIVIRSPQRKTSDVGEWRNAMQSADSGRMKRLYDLFDDLLIDGLLADAVDKRKDAIANAELTFQNANGEDVPEITDLIDTLEFEEMLRLLMDVRFWGRTGIEFNFSDGKLSVYEIPKKHINLYNQTILINDTDEVGISYEGDDNILVIGKKRDYGLFLKSAPFVIWKRGGFGDYAQWLEIFGMPQRVGKYSSYDPESRRLLEEALEKSGSAPWVVIPKESEVETTNNTGSGSSGAAYDDFRRACNEEMLITILGQTLTTVQGEKGARSLGEVHKEVEEGKNKADMRFIQRILNQMIVPVLEKRGFPVKDGKFIFPEAAESLEVSEIVELSNIIEIPASYLHDKYSIPMPKKGEIIARRQNTQATIVPSQKEPAQTEPKQEQDDPPKKRKLFSRFFAYAPTKERGDQRNFATRLIDSITGKLTLSDKYIIDLEKLLQEALDEVYNNGKRGKKQPIVSKPLFEISNKALQQGINSVFSKMEFGKKNEEFINEFRHNTAVFAAFKNHRQTEEIVNLLYDEDGNLRSFREFKKLALQVSKDYNINWLQTEYNTAVRAARSAVNYRKALETKHLYPNLEYIESTASHQREEHLEYVGTILPIEHPWWDFYMPPSDWNCACSVRPTDKDVTAVPPSDLVNPVFKNNPGKTAEPFNLKEHPYIKDVCPYFDTCKRRLYGSRLKFDLSDKENPPIIPECKTCELARAYSENLIRINENRKKYEALGEEWEKIYFNDENGGYLAIHKKRLAFSEINKQEREKFKKEKAIAQVLSRHGFTVEMLYEPPRIPSPDALVNQILSDFKKTKGHNNIARYILEDVNKKGINTFYVEFENETQEVYNELLKLLKKEIKVFFYFTGREDAIYQNF